MRIAYIHQYFKTPSMPGGTRSYEMARRFVQAGHEVHVITSRGDTDRPAGWKCEVIDGINVHWLNLGYSNRLSYRRRLFAFAAFAGMAAIRARSVKADVVLASSTPLTVAIPGVYATMGRRSNLVFEVRDLWPAVPIAIGTLKNPVFKALARGLESLAYRKSRAVVALSAGMAEGVRAKGFARELVVIPNACDNALFEVSDACGDHFRAARPWLGGRTLIVYCGALGLVNGVSFMVELAYEYRQLDHEARFLVIGDGTHREAVAALAGRLGVLDVNFFLESPIPKSEMPSVLNAASISCSWFIPVPEMEANSANKFFDSLAAGCPIAINYGGWHAKEIENSSLGVVLNPISPRASAQMLFRFLGDPDSMARSRLSSKHLAHTVYDRDLLSDRMLSVLEGAAP